MGKALSQGQIEQFWKDGYLFPLPALSREEAGRCRAALETFEAANGGPIASNLRHKVHLIFTWARDLVRNPRVLDAVEDLLGPDILCWSSGFFIKEAETAGYVSWHQDATYWGLDKDDVVTAWVALSEVTPETGPMQVIPGSHLWPQMDHRDTYHENNLLSRGQEIAVEVDETQAQSMPMHLGQMSLHHVKLAHASQPNRSKDRRIGFAIRYLPPSVRQTLVRDSATLVRGEDRFGYYDLEPAPAHDCDEAAMAAHADAVGRLAAALYQGTDKQVFRA